MQESLKSHDTFRDSAYKQHSKPAVFYEQNCAGRNSDWNSWRITIYFANKIPTGKVENKEKNSNFVRYFSGIVWSWFFKNSDKDFFLANNFEFGWFFFSYS